MPLTRLDHKRVRILLTLALAAALLLICALAAASAGGPESAPGPRQYVPLAAPQEPPLPPEPDFLGNNPGAGPGGIYVFYDWANLDPKIYPIRGGHMNLGWNTIDTGGGIYNWSAMDSWIKGESALKKLSVITFDSYDGSCCNYVPAYLRASRPSITLTCPDGTVLPRYWDQAYKDAFGAFVRAAGQHYDRDARVGWVQISAGIYGETQPAEEVYQQCLIDAGLNSGIWVDFVKWLVDTYKAAFPHKALVLQYGPYFQYRSERSEITDYAAAQGVGLKNDGLKPDQDDAIINDATKSYYGAGAYDPIIKWSAQVPTGWEGYEQQASGSMRGRTATMWSIYNALDKHADYLMLDVDLVQASDRLDLLKWGATWLGKTISNTPGVWVALRETEGTWYPQYGNYSYWLHQRDSVPGGKTVPLWNVGSAAEGRYTRRTDQASGNASMYFDVDDRFMFSGTNQVTITITYLDAGTDRWELRYDSTTGLDKVGRYVTKTNTGTWKRVVTRLNDARFSGRQPGRSDFRIWSAGDGDETIHLVQIVRVPGTLAAPTSTSTPGPSPTRTLTRTSTWTATRGPSPTPTSTRTSTTTPTKTLTPTPTRTSVPATPTPTPGALGWQRVYGSPGTSWRDLRFIGRSVAYASGGPEWSMDGPGKVVKTTDGGATWKELPVNADGWLWGIDCKDANTCWTAGRHANIRRTTDGGATWQAGNVPADYTGFLYGVRRTGVGDTLLVGATCNETANFMRATDGMNFSGLILDKCFVQWEISCPAAGICYSAAKGRIYRSADNGLTWEPTYTLSAPSARYYSVFCLSANVCWAAGDSGQIQYTTDGGANWQMSNGPAATDLFQRIRMLDTKHGYAVGDGSILYRTDDGVNWRRLASPTTNDLYGLQVFTMDDLFVADWGGDIWHYGSSAVPFTATPTRTAVPPTSTPTRTAIPPTSTPTRTGVPPTATPTRTAVPPTVTPTPTSAAVATWRQLYSRPGTSWRGIRFEGRGAGYAWGGPDWDIVAAGVVVKTTDGGQTWNDSPANAEGWLWGFDCKDANTCWTAGRYGTILRTLDGGASWQLADNADGYTGFLYGVRRTGIGDTVVAGSSCQKVLRASDGFTFTSVLVSSCLSQWEYDCPAAGICYGAASGHTIFQTRDNGLTWTGQQLGYGNYYSVDCTDASTCWVAGDYSQIQSTADGGATWRTAAGLPEGLVFDRIRMLNARQGYAVGDGGLIFRTDDGVNWRQLPSFTTGDLYGLYLFGMDDLYAVDWSGNIWYYGSTWPPPR